MEVFSETGKQKGTVESKMLWTPWNWLEKGQLPEEELGGKCRHSDEKE